MTILCFSFVALHHRCTVYKNLFGSDAFYRIWMCVTYRVLNERKTNENVCILFVVAVFVRIYNGI